MAFLSPLQIAQTAYNDGGFRGSSIAWITACALAESGGNTLAVSGVESDSTRGYGLVQIETENVQGGDWQDPAWQMQKAFAMSSAGTNFNPWCTACSPMPGLTNGKGCGGYGSGAAISHLAAAYEAADQIAVIPNDNPWPGTLLTLEIPMIQWHGTQRVQTRLNQLLLTGLVTDGWYGPSTAAAVRRFQMWKRLTTDSTVGAVTWGALFP